MLVERWTRNVSGLVAANKQRGDHDEMTRAMVLNMAHPQALLKWSDAAQTSRHGGTIFSRPSARADAPLAP